MYHTQGPQGTPTEHVNKQRKEEKERAQAPKQETAAAAAAATATARGKMDGIYVVSQNRVLHGKLNRLVYHNNQSCVLVVLDSSGRGSRVPNSPANRKITAKLTQKLNSQCHSSGGVLEHDQNNCNQSPLMQTSLRRHERSWSEEATTVINLWRRYISTYTYNRGETHTRSSGQNPH